MVGIDKDKVIIFMKKRTISTIFLLVALYLSLWFSGIYAAGVWVLIASIMTQIELNKFLRSAEVATMSGVTQALAIVYPLLIWHNSNFVIEYIVACVFLLILMSLLMPTNERFFAIITGIFSFILVPFAFGFMILLIKHFQLLYSSATATAIIIWVVFTTKFTDIGGLLVGSICGKNKLAPSISPLKTWEGVIGGILVAIVFGIISLIFFEKYMPPQMTIFHAMITSFAISIAAIIADLVESVLKRYANVKDSGNVIPGIGGVFDLTDSFILAAPVAYCLLKNFLN